MTRARVYQGDCIEVLGEIADGAIDSIVTDPPYGLRFMGSGWDDLGFGSAQQAWHRLWVEEALRVLKPGGHLLAFGGTRTYHHLACALEDSGFEIRDTICWLYGSGFPKSLDVSKAIDRAAGAEREAAGPATAEARRWEGWGTALKPAHEPVVVARKPLAGTVVGNVLEHDTGALNVDGCRIEGVAEAPGSTPPSSVGGQRGSMAGPMDRVAYDPTKGRWPANVVLDEDAAAMLDQQTGETSYNPPGRFGEQRVDQPGDTPAAFAVRKGGDGIFGYGDRGGASRFFYCAKASRAERNAGLDGERNTHPTVKPVKLMRWLVRLVTPPGGLVLDPFAGSGTTGVAAISEGFEFLGIEVAEESVRLAKSRIRHARGSRKGRGL